MRAPNVPPDLDRLMWAVAEAQDRKALTEFSERHPDLAKEMGKRFAMVADLRGSRPPVTPRTRPVPAFRRRPEPRPLFGGRWLVAAASLGILALGFASFQVARTMSGPNEPMPARVEAPPLQPNWPTASDGPRDGFVLQGEPTPTPSPAPPPRTPLERTASVNFQDIDLRVAVIAIAAEAGFVVDFAPGFPEMRLERIWYPETRVIEILRDLGFRMGFSVFTQERNRLLIVPAVAPDAVPPGLPGQVELPPSPPSGDDERHDDNGDPVARILNGSESVDRRG